MSMTPEDATALRKPFPPESVGKLPKGGTMLDYVGHAAVTDRLLTVDPNWTWEPFALGPDGLPAVSGGNLWIRLTVCGVTRIGVGDGKNAKECIGDAIRNAAMRFGVALDLWAKENLVEFAQAAQAHRGPTPSPEYLAATSTPADPEDLLAGLQKQAATAKASRAQVQKVVVMMDKRGIRDRDAVLSFVRGVVGRDISSRNELTPREASDVMTALEAVAEIEAAVAEHDKAQP